MKDRTQDQKPQLAQSTPIVNIPESLNRLGGDESLLLELIAIFLEDAPLLLDSMSSAILRKEEAAFAGFAHRLKGLVSNFSAHQCSALAWELEKRGRGQTDCNPGELWEQLRKETNAVRNELELFRERVT